MPILADSTERRNALITADAVEVDFGVDLLDEDEVLVDDISEDVQSATVHRDNYATIHGTIDMSISRELEWDTARVRPWMKLTSGGYYYVWYLGVYLPTTPAMTLGDSSNVFEVTGYDKLSLLDRPIGDTAVVTSSTAYLTAVESFLSAAGLSDNALIDGNRRSSTLSKDFVWLLYEENITYLSAINDLLTAVGYRGMYCDTLGRFRAERYVVPSTRPPSWTFDLSDLSTQIVNENRRMTKDEWTRTNWRRFVIANLDAAPSESGTFNPATDTQYTIDDSTDTEYRRVYYLDVEDGYALQYQGDLIRYNENQGKQEIDITCGPNPALSGHFDVVDYTDEEAGGTLKCQVSNWSLPLDGGDMSLTLEVLE